jgi:hypothetical protein
MCRTYRTVVESECSARSVNALYVRVYDDDCGGRLKVCVEDVEVGVAFPLSEPTWITLTEWISSTGMMSIGLAAPDSRKPSSCATTSSSDSVEKRPGPYVGIRSRSSSGVGRILNGIPTVGPVRR